MKNKTVLSVIFRVVVAAALMMGASMATLLVWLLPPAAAVAEDPNQLSAALSIQILSWFIAPAIAIIAVALLARRDGRSLRSLGLTAAPRMLLIGLFALLGSIAVAAIGQGLAALAGARSEPELLADPGVPLGLFVAWLIARALVLQGFGEELIWRGWLQQTIRVRPVTAALISTVGFTSLHLVSSGGQQSMLERVIYLAVPFGFGLAAAALMLRTGSLWAAVGVHTGFHLGTALAGALGIMVTGPIAWLSQGGAFALVGLVVLAWRSNRARTPDAATTSVTAGVA